MPYRGIALPATRYQVLQILIDQPVGADEAADLLLVPTVRYQFRGGGHIDTVHVGVTDRRCRGSKINLVRPCIARHFDNLPAGCAAYDRIIDQQHVLALELQTYGVEFLAHRLLALTLARHDESASYIAVFHQSLAELDIECMRDGLCRYAACIRYRDHHIDIVIRALRQDLVCEVRALPHAGLVNRYAIHQ